MTVDTQPLLDFNQPLLDFIIEFKIKHNGVSPTVKEIGSAMRLGKTAVWHRLRTMHRLGQIVLLDGIRTRNIAVPNSRWVKL